MSEGPMAGLAVRMPPDEYPMVVWRGVTPYANYHNKNNVAKGDLRARVRFSRSAKAKAVQHRCRKTMQPHEPGQPVFPDEKDVEDIELILAREKAARKRAWKMAKRHP